MARQQWAVVTANSPQYRTQENFDAGTLQVLTFDTFDDAQGWAIENPHYITEVVEITDMKED